MELFEWALKFRKIFISFKLLWHDFRIVSDVSRFDVFVLH